MSCQNAVFPTKKAALRYRALPAPNLLFPPDLLFPSALLPLVHKGVLKRSTHAFGVNLRVSYSNWRMAAVGFSLVKASTGFCFVGIQQTSAISFFSYAWRRRCRSMSSLFFVVVLKDTRLLYRLRESVYIIMGTVSFPGLRRLLPCVFIAPSLSLIWFNVTLRTAEVSKLFIIT